MNPCCIPFSLLLLRYQTSNILLENKSRNIKVYIFFPISTVRYFYYFKLFFFLANKTYEIPIKT